MSDVHTIESMLINARAILTKTRRTIEEEAIWLRKGCALDLILGAHLNRTVRAIESVFALAEMGAGHDATALSRVVLEHSINAVSVAMSGDPERESYLFIAAQHRHVRDSRAALKKHYPDLPETDATMISNLQSLVKEVDQSGFSEKMKPIVEKLDRVHSPDERMFSWLYEVPYSAMSNYVHPRALGLRTMTAPLGEPFTFIVKREEDLSMNAVRHAVMGLLVVCLAVVHSWTSPSLERTLLAPIEEFVKTAGQAGQFNTFEI